MLLSLSFRSINDHGVLYPPSDFPSYHENSSPEAIIFLCRYVENLITAYSGYLQHELEDMMGR